MGDIKNVSLHLAAKFWWIVVRRYLCLTSMDNVLTLDRAVLIASFIASYDIKFSRWIWAEIRKGALRELTTLSFSCLGQRLYYVVGVTPITYIDQRVDVTHMENICIIKHNHILFWVRTILRGVLF